MALITGRMASTRQRFFIGLIGCACFLTILLPLLLGGYLDGMEYRGLDRLQSHLADSGQAGDDIVMIYVDQKSLDSILYSLGYGWPWPRHAYALVVDYLRQAGAKAVIFDAIFSEPSVFADQGDDDTLAEALQASGRVVMTFTLHKSLKMKFDETDRASAEAAEYQKQARQRFDRLAQWAVDFTRQGGPDLLSYQDVTMPIAIFDRAVWGLGYIDIEPEKDGVTRRMRPAAQLEGRTYATLALESYLKINGIKKLTQQGQEIQTENLRIPLDREGKTLIKYYGGLGVFREYSMAAIIRSAMEMQQEKKPLVAPADFKDKIVFIGAKAAGLYDLRSTPLENALPGVDIHATFFNNLLQNDFLRRAGGLVRAAACVLLLVGTLAAAILNTSVIWGLLASIGLTGLYLAGVIAAFKNNIWLDAVSPVMGQVGVFIMAGLINYYGEGRQKRAVKSAFSLYLSPQVVAQVLENPGLLTLGGSRRVMSCFFSDLAGFTTISEALNPEDLVSLLNRYLSLMTRIIMDSGGTVDKFEGDAIMAFWGAPLIQEDHALRACLAAIDQQKAMTEFRRQTLAEGLPELRVRMGVNTGPMIVGNMGSEERFDYTVMGDTVNLASRLEGANKPYGTYIMISEFTLEPVRELVEVRELDLLRVKGKLEPIRVYELLARAGDLSSEKAGVVEIYLKGLKCYRDMDFQQALAFFQQALTLDPEDNPSRAYIERCRTFLENPPPNDWDRVFTMTTKQIIIRNLVQSFWGEDMKNIRFYLSGPVLVVLLTMMFCTAALAETLYVQNEKADIREGKGAFFPVVYTASKAEALTVVQREGSWLKVVTPNGPGWIYEKALAAKKPKSGGILAGAADTSELDKTAGFKGFDEPTERAYISKNKLQAQMRQIDQMEMPPFTPAELRNFQLKGRVGPLGGGR